MVHSETLATSFPSDRRAHWSTMTREAEDLVRRWIEVIWNQGDLEVSKSSIRRPFAMTDASRTATRLRRGIAGGGAHFRISRTPLTTSFRRAIESLCAGSRAERRPVGLRISSRRPDGHLRGTASICCLSMATELRRCGRWPIRHRSLTRPASTAENRGVTIDPDAILARDDFGATELEVLTGVVRCVPEGKL
jgi:hypothetical protein